MKKVDHQELDLTRFGYPGKTKKRKKWIIQSSSSPNFAQFEEISVFSIYTSIIYYIYPEKNENTNRVDHMELDLSGFTQFEEISSSSCSVFSKYMSRKNRKNESGSSLARFCQIWFNLKRFQQIVQFFSDISPGKNEQTKKRRKWITWSQI